MQLNSYIYNVNKIRIIARSRKMSKEIVGNFRKRRNYRYSPRVQIVVPLVDRFRHFLHTCSIVLLINSYQLLSELIKKFNVMFILMQLGVERLREREKKRDR